MNSDPVIQIDAAGKLGKHTSSSYPRYWQNPILVDQLNTTPINNKTSKAARQAPCASALQRASESATPDFFNIPLSGGMNLQTVPGR
jgi:hypothetical protein